jgi:putative DNA-invertase from lambdoid prophage Rac
MVVYLHERADGHDGYERELFEIDAAGYLLDMSAVFVEQCSCAAPAQGRPRLQAALRRVRGGDTLLVTELWYLGNSAADVVATLETLTTRGASVVCLAYGRDEPITSPDHPMVRSLRLVVGLERLARQARSREAAGLARRQGTPQGRPASLSASQRKEALRALASGSTVTEVAHTLKTSRQTIMRLRDANTAK